VAFLDQIGRSHLDRSPGALSFLVVLASSLAVAALIGVASVAGWEPVLSELRRVHFVWFSVALGAEVVAYAGYMLGYREVARVEGGPVLDHGRTAAAVAAGFGAFVARGGTAVDLHAFQDAGVSRREARVRVLGLGALEYSLLAPAACASAIFLLATRPGHPSEGLTLPWAIAVPVGFALALYAVDHRMRFRDGGRWRDQLGQALDSIHVLRCLFTQRGHLLGPVGAAVYWSCDILCLWACVHAFTHGPPSVPLLLIGYATGYALTRRSLPLGGAGAVEALLPFALSWVGISLAAAVVAVFAYRVFNLWAPLVPAALGLRALRQPG
jgi:uncharacterized membrane protein YbhN (UPF0104 family)